MKTLTWNKDTFFVDGKVAPLISGEFHYFRVPKEAWRERLVLLKASGANTAATYIPWLIHEPREGEIIFDDIPERSLTDFLKLCCELDIMVIVRPGPYSYSELCNDGLPFWLGEKYPETRAHGAKGERHTEEFNASYLHPVFLEKARRYIRAVNGIVRPFLATNGGCVVSCQIDNEIGGKDLWRHFLDCNKEAMGIGAEEGHYVRFLREKYGDIQALNLRYGTAYESFCDVDPYINTPDESTLGGKRFNIDYRNFYRLALKMYVEIIASWLTEDGIDVSYCTNAGSSNILPYVRDFAKVKTSVPFLLGVDHYYALSPAAGISMTPEKTVKYILSLDMLEALGMPPSVLEMQSGSASCYPPILPNNLNGFYMTHVALGMKGSNYYVFTGGPNFENTGNNTEIYDYHAPVSATGEVRPIYYAQKARNEFSLENDWLLTAKRSYDLQIGFCWETAQNNADRSWSRYSDKGIVTRSLTESVLLTESLIGRLVKCVEVGGELDVDVPLIAITDERMEREKQEALVSFVKRGGRLILMPTVPEYDEDLMPCRVLADFLGVDGVRAVESSKPVILKGGERVYGIDKKLNFEGFRGEILAHDEKYGSSLIEYKSFGEGAVVLLGASYEYKQFCQADMLELCLERLSGARRVHTDCKNLIVTLFENSERAICFLINNLADRVSARMSVEANGREYDLGELTVEAMSVLTVELK